MSLGEAPGAASRAVTTPDGEPAVATSARRRAWVAGAGAGAVVTGVLWLFSARQWALYRVPSWDLGIFTQVLRAYSELRSPVVTIKGEDFMILGDHFHPLLVVLAPFYALHPSGFTLLAAQAVLFGLTAGIVTWAAVKHVGWWGVAIGLACGLSHFVVEAHAAQFHEVALAMPLLAMAMAMLVDRRGVAACAWALPLVLVKEDLGLTVAAVGVVVAIRAASSRERRAGLATAAFGVLAFVVITQWVLPALNPDGVWDYADDSILSLALSDPGAALTRLGTGFGVKAGTVLLALLVTGVVCVRSPLALVALPTLAWRVSSDVAYHWGTHFHYGAVLAPILYLALVDALGLLTRDGSRGVRRRWLVPALGAGTLALTLLLQPRFALWTLTQSDTWAPNARAATLREAENQVADGEAVDMDITLMAYLAPRAEVYWIGNTNPVPDVVVIDRSSGVLHPPPDDVAAYAGQLFPGTTWETVWDTFPVGVARPVG